jgi:NADPH-dependent 2,4-dienoyl-CoA reductase/sulfur reductase-like enzyme
MQNQRHETADRYDFKLRRIAADFLWIATFARADRNAIVRDRWAPVNWLLHTLKATVGDIKNNQFMAIIRL